MIRQTGDSRLLDGSVVGIPEYHRRILDVPFSDRYGYSERFVMVGTKPLVCYVIVAICQQSATI